MCCQVHNIPFDIHMTDSDGILKNVHAYIAEYHPSVTSMCELCALVLYALIWVGVCWGGNPSVALP